MYSVTTTENVSVVQAWNGNGGKLLKYINIEKSLVRVIMAKLLVSKSSLCVSWPINKACIVQ